jgi:predicted phosphodiesterase
MQYGKDCFSFVFMTDTHYPSNLGKISPILAKKIMDETNIKFVLHTGDAQTRGLHSTKEAILAENADIEAMFKPILDRMLFVEGNHDGSYGMVDGVTYAQQLNENEMFAEYYRRVGLTGDIRFADDCNAYYVDDTANKVRYIGLNSQCVPNGANDVNENGSAKYSKFGAVKFMQSQFDFLTNEALTQGLTDKWKVVVFAHIYIWKDDGGDYSLMVDLLSAYQNKTTYSGSYSGDYGNDAVSVNVDFTNAKGKLVGYFSGHNHIDAVQTPSSAFKVITSRCDAREENDSTLNAERVEGTITEQSFDVFTVTKDTIYATKIGAGSDREISY